MLDGISSLLNSGLELIVPMIVLLGLLIFVHELGHFLAAKYFKVRVETFSLGFGPKLIKFVRGDTTYCVSAFPLGGYVKMFGDEPGKDIAEDLKPHSFLHKPVSNRIVIALAGPLMNLFFATFLFYIVANIGDKALAPKIGEIPVNSAAYEAGFRNYDKVLSVNGQNIETWDQLNKIIENSSGKTLSFDVERGEGEKHTLSAMPRSGENKNILFSTQERVGQIDGLSSKIHISMVGLTQDSPLRQAGMINGDQILSINGEELQWFKDIQPAVDKLIAEDKEIVFKIKRFINFKDKDGFKEYEFKVAAEEASRKGLGLFIPEAVVAEVQEDSPAFTAGLKKLDKIEKINGKEIHSFNDIISGVSKFEPGDEPLNIEVLRKGELKEFQMTPKMTGLEGQFGEKENRFTIGVMPFVAAAPQTFIWKSTSFGHAAKRALKETWRWTKVTVISFWRIIQNRVSAKNLGGFISIGQIAHQSWQIGPSPFVKMMAILSINLFILNLLPIPILDGGHLVLFTLEAIKGSAISTRKVEVAQQIGFFIILFLMAFALFNDFTRVFGS